MSERVFKPASRMGRGESNFSRDSLIFLET